ncbi:hypothetical protein [Noviherbaspirillum aridicola]|uniref:Uncharacterized protein n=1 Tax=Noviherbaspirillum aridicola TaxID=2849687 RepID=A0ABQ4Q007_9BURK|nr:hypothetical protein [Noviherbaspirillum aridicola]GIZ50361.1 hypothetical protein NCCP691_03750 [Noviherbaspirillum aridicola]
MATDVIDKVDVSKIELETVEGTRANARVTSMEAANHVLERWVHDEQETRNAECEVHIVFEDGFRLHSRYPLTRSDKRVSLARHLRKQLNNMASSTRARKPCRRDSGCDIRLNDDCYHEAAKEALERYNI